jgi:voltage-gated potassium channel
MGIITYWNPKLFSKISYFIFLLFLVLSIGTGGFMLIEGWGLIDSFYMTIITVSTVGFSEVDTLSLEGKLFTAALIISSFGTFAYSITSITKYLVGGEYRKIIREKKLMKDLKKFHDHVIICGFGRVGQQVAQDLISVKIDFVILEKDHEIVDQYELNKDYKFLQGDATEDENLRKANMADAKAVISCLPKDADNVYVVLSARELGKHLLIVSRANNASAVSKLKSAGANNVILPDSIGGSHMASLISNPDVMEFLDILRVQGTEGANINSVSYDELPETWRNKTIKELDAHQISGVSIIGFKTADGEYIINPDESLKVIEGTRLFVIGSTEEIKVLKNHLGLTH